MIEALLTAFGRAHLLALHFPIALLLVAALIEVFRMVKPRQLPAGVAADSQQGQDLLRMLRQTPTPSAYTCLFFASLFGVAAAGSGWLYAWKDFSTTLGSGTDLELHRWIGTAAALLSVVALAMGMGATLLRRPIATNLYRVVLLLAAIAVGWAGHLGGEEVHGEGFVIEPLLHRAAPLGSQDESAVPADAAGQPGAGSGVAVPEDRGQDLPTEEALVSSEQAVIQTVSFARDIKPIFEQHCYRCHNSDRDRGDYRLDTLEEAMQAIVPGNSEASALVELMRLPESNRNSMPKNKPNRPAGEIQLIADWIDAMEVDADAESLRAELVGVGASESAAGSDDDAGLAESVVRTTPGPEITRPASSRALQAADEPIILTREQREARDLAITGLRNRRVSAAVRSQNLDMVEVRVFEARTEFGDADLELLNGLEPCLTMLDLTGTAVTDAGLAMLAEHFQRLRVLKLGQTGISDAGVGVLRSLPELVWLDVNQTRLTQAGLRAVSGSDSLLLLRAWGCPASSAELAEIRADFPSVRIEAGD